MRRRFLKEDYEAKLEFNEDIDLAILYIENNGKQLVKFIGSAQNCLDQALDFIKSFTGNLSKVDITCCELAPKNYLNNGNDAITTGGNIIFEEGDILFRVDSEDAGNIWGDWTDAVVELNDVITVTPQGISAYKSYDTDLDVRVNIHFEYNEEDATNELESLDPAEFRELVKNDERLYQQVASKYQIKLDYDYDYDPYYGNTYDAVEGFSIDITLTGDEGLIRNALITLRNSTTQYKERRLSSSFLLSWYVDGTIGEIIERIAKLEKAGDNTALLTMAENWDENYGYEEDREWSWSVETL